MAWMSFPRDIVLTTKFGKVRMTARVAVTVGDESGPAHINDETPALVYREQEYIGMVFFVVDATGRVAVDDSTRPRLSKRPQGTDAPDFYSAAMVAAIAAAVQDHIDANPEVLRLAERARLNNEMDSARAERDATATLLRSQEATVAELEKRLAEWQ